MDGKDFVKNCCIIGKKTSLLLSDDKYSFYNSSFLVRMFLCFLSKRYFIKYLISFSCLIQQFLYNVLIIGYFN